ncbi:MAG: hypothetical protein H7061_09630 [Bdellovibrionaceae bacterium]|nr:hypothetical protein [Bdellovibrio sp.]
MKLSLLYFLFAGFSLKVQAYPEIIAWRATPIIAFENKTHAPLAKSYLLKSPFSVVTASEDELTLRFTDSSEVIIYPKSKLQIPEVAASLRALYELFLIDGEIRLKNSGPTTEGKPIQIQTVFFDLPQPKGVDAIIFLDMKVPSIEVRMIRGEWPLEFYAFEKKITLKAGEKVKFTGVLSPDGDAIKYDYLLANRKIPQGKLGAVEKFDFNQFIEKEKAIEKAISDRKKAGEQSKIDKIKKRKAYEASFLCHTPFGQKDQCAWWTEAKKCYRKRCNVGGEWGAVTERPTALEPKCAKEFTVSDCDY